MSELDRYFSRLDQTFDKIRARRELPSISAAIYREGHLAWKGACGLASS